MAGSPYIKTEPNDFNNFDPSQFMQYNQGFRTNGNPMNINPATLSNGNGMQSNMNQGSMSSSFNIGNSGIADDELLDLDFNQNTNNQQNGYDFNQGMQHLLSQQQQLSMYSHTPDGQPMQSPFTGDFNYSQFRPGPNQQQFTGGQSMPTHPTGIRPGMQHRKVSDSRSPASPNTPGMSHLHVGSGDFSHPAMAISTHQRQQNSIGNGWDSTPSGHSWNESSPFPSPVNGHPPNRLISEVLKNQPQHHHHKVASSLPTKMENGGQNYQNSDAKRRRRRESHNMVERRRRDNINERIQDLGMLVPQHRLEDEKVRKHLQTNAPLSPSIANATTASMSPPNPATSLLAGPQARRATGATGTGGITQGLPLEDKDKGPNKGDILNGSVAWTRDLMWYMHKKLREEQQVKNLVAQLGGAWPFEEGEEDKRMHSEICEVLNKHAHSGDINGYSRAPGSGLRVPNFTNLSGDSTGADGQVTGNGYGNPQAMSPGFQSGGSGISSGQMSHQGQNQYWGGDFKEEDEYGMEV